MVQQGSLIGCRGDDMRSAVAAPVSLVHKLGPARRAVQQLMDPQRYACAAAGRRSQWRRVPRKRLERRRCGMGRSLHVGWNGRRCELLAAAFKTQSVDALHGQAAGSPQALVPGWLGGSTGPRGQDGANLVALSGSEAGSFAAYVLSCFPQPLHTLQARNGCILTLASLSCPHSCSCNPQAAWSAPPTTTSAPTTWCSSPATPPSGARCRGCRWRSWWPPCASTQLWRRTRCWRWWRRPPPPW